MLKLERFIYEIENTKTKERIKLNNFNNPVENTDDIYTFLNITLKYKYITFDYTSSELESKKKSDWLNLISQNGFNMHLNDSYGSHCDNGQVSITNINNESLLFVNDTATGGDISVKIPINKCRSAIEEIANKYYDLWN